MLTKCPICEVNLMLESEDACNVCKNINIIERRKHKIAPKNYVPKAEIEKKFLKYLESKGYSMYTPSDLQSTAYSYLRAINNIIYHEGLTWDILAQNHKKIIPIYDVGGEKEIIGNKSHKTVINALKRFEEFMSEYRIK